jgi:hypothetical protein
MVAGFFIRGLAQRAGTMPAWSAGRSPIQVHTCRLFVIGDQSGRTSAPIMPHTVQTIRPHSDRTGK